MADRPSGEQVSERLTEEQVGEALGDARYLLSLYADHDYSRCSRGRSVCDSLASARALLQLHADLEAARRSVQGLCVQLDETQEERNLAEGQRDRAASALSSLREAAMEAVECMEAWHCHCTDTQPRCESCDRDDAAVARLRSLLEVKA